MKVYKRDSGYVLVCTSYTGRREKRNERILVLPSRRVGGGGLEVVVEMFVSERE